MIIVIMLGWWYGQGWLWIMRGIGRQLARVSRTFAVKQLLKTWFAPWKQIYSPSTFRTFFTSLVDNTVSRFIGAFVRTIILFCALVMSVFVVGFGLIFAILWPLLPPSILLLPWIFMLAGATLK